ncbi:exo-beta-N-acetylmuramidase NamZ family protein [Chlorobium limicola]
MVATGLDILLDNIDRFRNRAVGMIVNQTSVTPDLRYSWDVLRKKGLNIRKIFSPEHGLFATEQDQIAVGHQPIPDIELVSLYGNSSDTLIPDSAALDDLDLILFDIQDVGSRYYTYVNTLALFMEAAVGRDLEIMVLDRPNPLGGSTVEGPMLDMEYRSFVGIFPVPVRHGMTPGELALLYRDWKKLDIRLTVLSMQGWNRSMLFPETGLPWVLPSPNMPTVETAAVYPGMCLFEGLNVSEGRGSTTPFQIFGAPFINPYHLLEACKATEFKGLYLRPTWFKPTFHKFRGETIGGLWLHIADHGQFRPFAAAVALTVALRHLYPGDLQFPGGVYEFNDTIPAFDLLAGNGAIRQAIVDGQEASSIIASWQQDETAFLTSKEQYHLYR